MKQISYLILLCLLTFSCKKEKQDCPLGYTGDDCTEEVKPKAVHILNVFLNSYSVFNGTANWDDFSQWADPYFTINDINGNILYLSDYKEEAHPGEVQIWDLNFICDPDKTYFIYFYDYDSANNDDFIGAVLFSAYVDGQDFPVEINLGTPPMTATVLVSYDYQ